MRRQFLFPAFAVLAGALLACLPLPASALAGRTVTATGLSFFEPGREAVAREKALDEARRAALEKAVGAYVESSTLVRDFMVVKDQIYTHARGYLRDLEVLDEQATDLGTYEVTIRADVALDSLADDMEHFRALLALQQNPRMHVVVAPGLPDDTEAAAVKARNMLVDRLSSAGFRVLAEPPSGDTPDAALRLELAVQVDSTTSRYQGLDISLNEISLSASLSRASDAQVLATASAVSSQPGENRLQALDRGSEECVRTLWKRLRTELRTVWQNELNARRDVVLVLKGVSGHAEAQNIAGVLASDVSGVTGASLARYTGGTAVYDLGYRGWPAHLVNELGLSYFRTAHFGFTVQEVSGNTVVLHKQ
jgi:hypothetical protein